MKKILALVLAAAMMVSIMSAFAAGADRTPDNIITISGLTEGDVVHFYKVVGWVGDGAGNYKGWKSETDYASILTSEQLAKMIDSTYTGYTGLTADLAGHLAEHKGSAVADVNVGSDGTASYTVAQADLGLYMAIITPKDVNTIYNPVFVSADWEPGKTNSFEVATSAASYETNAATKKTTLKLDKKSENSSDYNEDNGNTAAVGDTLTFTVTTTIPGYGHTFDEPAFTLKDTMNGLELQTGTLTVSTADGTYDKEATTDGYTIAWKSEYLRTLTTPVNVTITYQAKVLATAEQANVDKEYNDVTLEYSHDPSTETDGKPGGDKEYKKDVTNHYTFSIDADNIWKGSGKVGESATELVKISVDQNGNPIYESKHTVSNITTTEYEASPLADCVFELLDKDGNSFNPAKTVTTDAAGRLKFEGLDAGTYKLRENSAPAGYVRDTSVHTIVIEADINEVSITEYYDQSGNWYKEPANGRTAFTYTTTELAGYTVSFDNSTVATHTFINESNNTEIKWSSSKSSEAPSSIHNTKGLELPSTGGIGTTLFYLFGGIMVLSAGIVLVARRKADQE